MIAASASGGPGGPFDFVASALFWLGMGAVTVMDPDQVFATLVRWLS